ncbi:MAG: hypothetical protein JKX94_02750 [Sneathiella sp.]|nr:hypothetical protein [Sneathiella sp.]
MVLKKLIVGVLLAATFSVSFSYAESETEKNLYKPVIKAIINSVILPGYERLHSSAKIQTSSIKQHCHSANLAQHSKVQAGFKDLIKSWSEVEVFRFGPARKDNRYERLFFWPDRRSRGIKQVQKILASADLSILPLEILQKKSVAVQGILALEFTLFGQGSENLITGTKNSFRCLYAHAISTAIVKTSSDILNSWKNTEGYSQIMLSAGPNNAIFKNDTEVIRDILQRSSELLQSISALKLAPSLATSQLDARPKRVPLWRSNLFLHALDANLSSLVTLQKEGKLFTLLPLEDRGHASGLEFEFRQIRKALRPFIEKNTAYKDILASKEGYEKLSYISNPLKGANDILALYYPQILGITMGFNALDGD